MVTMRGWLFALLVIAAVGCAEEDGPAPAPQGTLLVNAVGLGNDDVVAVQYDITCEDGTTLSQVVPLETEGLPEHVSPTHAGEPFADLFATLAPGKCTVTATALVTGQDQKYVPAKGCPTVTQEVTVVADQTTEIVLVIECKPDPVGALDVVTVVTTTPSVVDIDFEGSKFNQKCDEVEVHVTAEGGTGPLTYTYEVIDSPIAAVYELVGSGPDLLFIAETPGMYLIKVTVSDGTSSSSFTFPIHISDDPDIEHCSEVCCKLKDGHVFMGWESACTNLQGQVVAEAACTEVICCKTAQGPATVPAADCPQGGVLPAAACETAEPVCCKRKEGNVTIEPSPEACTVTNGAIVPLALCEEEVCCKLANGLATVPASKCPAGQMVSAELCQPKEVCCRIGAEMYIVSDADCKAKGGIEASMELCLPEVCCTLPDGSYTLLPASTCKMKLGQPLAADMCKPVCCQIEGKSAPVNMTLVECQKANGFPVADEKCETQTYVWQADYTLNPDVECVASKYLVVPSTGANKLAVYDLTTLTPLPSTPFATCSSPSRIMMDANTDVYATCRGDGKVFKHTRDGVLLWGTQLPGCASSRGVFMSGNGRFFAGCSTFPGIVYELDAVTGAVVGSVTTNSQVYGIAGDSAGLYVADLFTSHVTKVTLNGPSDMTVAWQVNLGVYGISVDTQGRIWIGGSTLRALSTTDGSLLDTAPQAGFFGGVQVGLDGLVYAASGGANKVYRYDPATSTGTLLTLDPGANMSHGLTLDTLNNVYTVNMNSSSLTKVTPAAVATGFGGGPTVLNSPYGYSGDMTGMTTTCLAGTTETWFGSAVDSGSPATVWESISWTATTPAGSGVAVYYSLDGGTSWTQVTNGQLLNVTGQTFEVKVLLSSTIAGNEPTIHALTVVYHP